MSHLSKPQILMTGSTGLIGSRFVQDFSNQYQIINLGRDTQGNRVDITDLDALESQIQKYPEAQAIIHLAAFTDVSGAFTQSGNELGSAYQTNVVGTANLVELARSYHKFLIHISTAYVFDGNKREPYLETDTPHAIEWYGQTKLLAEQAILQEQTASNWHHWTILRLDQPFRSDSFKKVDGAHRIIAGLENNHLNPQFTNHWFGPTYINDLVRIFDLVLRRPSDFAGEIFHATSGEQWTDFDYALLIKNTLGSSGQVKPGNLDDYLRTLERPYQRNTALNCDKLRAKLDFEPYTIEQAIAQLIDTYRVEQSSTSSS